MENTILIITCILLFMFISSIIAILYKKRDLLLKRRGSSTNRDELWKDIKHDFELIDNTQHMQVIKMSESVSFDYPRSPLPVYQK